MPHTSSADLSLHEQARKVSDPVAKVAFPLSALAMAASMAYPKLMLVGFALALTPILVFFLAGARRTLPRSLWLTVWTLSGALVFLTLVGRFLVFPG